MSQEIVLKASKRELTGKKVKSVRRDGKLPCVVYGKHLESMPILLDLRDATKSLNNITPSTIVDLDIDGKIVMTLVREIQRDYILGTYRHVDFQAISENELVKANVQVVVVGVAPAVKNYNGVLVQSLTTIAVEALPRDLPEKFVIDIAVLKNLGDSYSVAKMAVAPGVKVLTDPRASIVLVTGKAGALGVVVGGGVDMEEPESDMTEPEVIAHGKKEEEE